MLAALGKLHPLTDTQVLPDAKLDLSHANASASHLPYSADVRICHMRGRHTGRRVYRVNVGRYKFRENVYMKVFFTLNI